MRQLFRGCGPGSLSFFLASLTTHLLYLHMALLTTTHIKHSHLFGSLTHVYARATFEPRTLPRYGLCLTQLFDPDDITLRTDLGVLWGLTPIEGAYSSSKSRLVILCDRDMSLRTCLIRSFNSLSSSGFPV